MCVVLNDKILFSKKISLFRFFGMVKNNLTSFRMRNFARFFSDRNGFMFFIIYKGRVKFIKKPFSILFCAVC